MTDFDMSALADRSQAYDSFIQLKSGGDRYRLKSLQSVDPQFVWPILDRVGDDGSVAFTPGVSQHKHNIQLLLTADEVDTIHPPTNTRTLSYYIYQKELRNSVQIDVSVVFVAKDASTNKFLRLDYTYELEQIGIPRINDELDVLVDAVGRIVPGSISFVRQSS